MMSPLQKAESEYAHDTLTIRFRPTKNPEHYQVFLDTIGMPLLGGPAVTPEQLPTIDALQPLRTKYAALVDMLHALDQYGLGAAADPGEMLALGREVAGLLPASARKGIVEALQKAQREQRYLRLVIDVDHEMAQLLAVPWELLVLPLRGERAFEAIGDDFVLHQPMVGITRQMHGVGQHTEPRIQQPLSVQAFLAMPHNGEPIAYEMTYQALEHVLSPDAARACWYAGPGTLQALQERLQQCDPQIVHILCHGCESPVASGVRYNLLFTHIDGGIQRVSAFDLAPILSWKQSIQLVILHICHSGTLSTADRTPENVALALVRQGIPAVVAMQGEVGQEAIGHFVSTLYRELGKGSALDYALAIARNAMMSIPHSLDWSLPVLYQGSGAAEVSTWYTRLADRLESAMHEPVVTRTVRGMVLAWALILLTVGLIRWLLLPIPCAPDLQQLVLPLAVWIGAGLLVPALIASGQRGLQERHDLAPALRRAAYASQWAGAYLGYALGGLLGMLLWVSMWVLGIFDLLPDIVRLWALGAAMFLAAGISYIISRSQWRSALAIAPVNAELFDRSTIAIILIAALIILCIPLLVFGIPSSPFPWFVQQPFAALGLAAALISFVFGLGR